VNGRRGDGYYGPLVPIRVQARLAPLFVILVVIYGYCHDHHVHSAQGLILAVSRDLAATIDQALAPPNAGGKPHKRGQRVGSGPPARTLPAPPPSRLGRADIPPAYLALYQSGARQCPGLDWSVLAGIGKVETNHGRSTLPGVHSGSNFAGAMGPMQFLAGTWAEYGRGGNVYDPADAIPAAARLLCANGAPGQLRQAIYAYNHAWWYVDQVLTFARAYQRGR
jgi:Transglycosylase SLT domain